MRGGPKSDSAYRVTTYTENGEMKVLIASEYLALLDARERKGSDGTDGTSSGESIPMASLLPNGQQINVPRENHMQGTGDGSGFDLWSKTGGTTSGSADSTLGPVVFASASHQGTWSVIVAGNTIARGSLGPESGTLPPGGAMTGVLSHWDRIAAGGCTTLTGALAMAHKANWSYQNQGTPKSTTMNGVAGATIEKQCDDDDAEELPPPPPPPSNCIDAYTCEDGSGNNYPTTQNGSVSGTEQFSLGAENGGPSGSTILVCDYIQWYQRSFIGGVWTPWIKVGNPTVSSCYFA